MISKETIRIITALANGLDPDDGKPLAPSNPCRRLHVSKALHNVLREGGQTPNYVGLSEADIYHLNKFRKMRRY